MRAHAILNFAPHLLITARDRNLVAREIGQHGFGSHRNQFARRLEAKNIVVNKNAIQMFDRRPALRPIRRKMCAEAILAGQRDDLIEVTRMIKCVSIQLTKY